MVNGHYAVVVNQALNSSSMCILHRFFLSNGTIVATNLQTVSHVPNVAVIRIC